MRIDELMPEYDFIEHHEIEVDADKHTAFEAIHRFDLVKSPLSLALLFIRGIPHLMGGKVNLTSRLDLGAVKEMGFVVVGEEPGAEIVLGIVGRFWRLNSSLLRMSGPEVLEFETPGYCKALWNFRVEEIELGRTLVVTETRIACLGDAAVRRFRLYWRIVGPFSALIRILILRQIRKLAEISELKPAA